MFQIHSFRQSYQHQSNMFNQEKTPSYFIRQTISSTNQSPTASISRSSVHHSPKKEMRPEHSTKKDKPLDVQDDHVEESDTTCYKSVSVCTRWRWDDVFRTINTTDDEGRFDTITPPHMIVARQCTAVLYWCKVNVCIV